MAYARIDPRRIKMHRSYSIGELAALLGCHKNSVRTWARQGLEPLLDGQRPLLFQGADVRTFLLSRRTKAKRKCRPEELYCFKCRCPREPAGGMADFRCDGSNAGLLSGICAQCSTMMFKRVALAKIDTLTCLDLKILTGPATPKLAA